MPSDARWAVEGDRGVTYSATPPEGSRIVVNCSGRGDKDVNTAAKFLNISGGIE